MTFELVTISKPWKKNQKQNKKNLNFTDHKHLETLKSKSLTVFIITEKPRDMQISTRSLKQALWKKHKGMDDNTLRKS